MEDKLILVLYEHRFFGWKYTAFSAEETESGSMRILGAAATGESKSEAEQEIRHLLRLVSDMTDQALMKLYSKKKTTAEFHKEITPELLEKYIRPRIEKLNYQITEIARRIDIPVFIRTDLSNNTLFVQNRLSVKQSPSECVFHFIKDDNGIRYYITMTHEGREIPLRNKRGIILSDKPSVILIDKTIYSVEAIESKKLIPFLTKEYISVPPASEKMYIRTFITKALMDYTVKIEGIPLRQIHPPQKAVLSLESVFDLEFVLLLSFHYGNDRFLCNDRQEKIIHVGDETPGIEWYYRDRDWEDALVRKIEETGLKREWENYWAIPSERKQYGMIEWLSREKERLQQDFQLEQRTDIRYYTGPILKESVVEEKIDWFEVKIIIIAGEYRIPFNRFRKHILEGKKEYLLPDGSLLILPDEWFTRYYDLLRYSKGKEGWLQTKKIHAPVIALALDKEIEEEMRQQLQAITEVPMEHPPLPAHIKAELRPYQKEGFYWLWHLYRHSFGGCLADDMGLGKTLQTITLLQYIYERAADERQKLPACLVVAPTSLLHNWRNELKRFAPQLRVFIYSGTNRMRTKQIGQIFDRFEVVITSYGVVRKDIEFIREYTFQTVILDESQYIKNPASLSYQAVEQLQTPHRFVLTGTPIENSLEDLWAQFNFINEGLLGSYSSFRKEFIQKIVKEKNSEREKALRQMIAPFMLRRTKEEVTPELPPLLQQVIYCDMADEQQEIYTEEKNRIRNTLLQAKENPREQANPFIALQGLNRLRQMANHPRLVDPEYTGDSGKYEQILLSFENLKAGGHKVLIFSSYVKHLHLLAETFNQRKWKYAILTGETLHREEEISRFTQREDVHCFFISLKAGATGLNLTAADYVFIIDPWWNPAAEMQALSRAHRIGQDKPVFAYRFISTDTIEEKILHLQEYKSTLYDTFIDVENPLSALNWEDIEELLD